MKNVALAAAVFLLSVGGAAAEGPQSYGEVSFQVGPEQVALVLLPGAGGEAEPFYRVSGPISPADAEEHPDCFDAAGFRYHRRDCPALRQFFEQHGFDAQSVTLRPTDFETAPETVETFRERRLPQDRRGDSEGEGAYYRSRRTYRYAPYYSYYGPYDYYGYYGPYAYYGFSPWLSLGYGYGYWPYSYYGHRGYYGYYGHGHYYGHGKSGHRPGAAARTRSRYSGSAGFRGQPSGAGRGGAFNSPGGLSSRGFSGSSGGAARTRGSAIRR